MAGDLGHLGVKGEFCCCVGCWDWGLWSWIGENAGRVSVSYMARWNFALCSLQICEVDVLGKEEAALVVGGKNAVMAV